MKPYTPQVGDSVGATRRIKSNIYANTIVGRVTETWENACRIVTNPGTAFEAEFRLYYQDWTFQNLYIVTENTQDTKDHNA